MAKRKIIDVRRGGVLLPVGNNIYLAKGRTHEQGGIDIGDDLEIENNELAQVDGDSLKIFSAQPILNGYSPSQLVLGGANPDRVFNAQERFKDVNHLNDDGTRKKRNGGEEKNDNTYIAPIINDNLSREQLKERIKNDTEELDSRLQKIPRAVLAGINIFDPTGISNYPNLFRSIRSGNTTDIVIDALGSLPLVKGLALTTKLGRNTRRLNKIERKLNRWIEKDKIQKQINNGYEKLNNDIKNNAINETTRNFRFDFLNKMNTDTYNDVRYFDRINTSQQIGKGLIQEDNITDLFRDDNKRCGGKKRYGDRMKYIKSILRW